MKRATIDKQVKLSFLITKVGIIVVTINNHMAIIKLQIGKNTIEDVLLDGGSGINIITKQLRLRFRLPKLKLIPYNLKMLDQTTTITSGFD